MSESGYIEWEVEVEEPGFYNVAILYYPVEGSGTAIERELAINGKRPFEEAGYLVFHRVWGDAEPIKKDNQGNELRPLQHEIPMCREIVLSDSIGTHREPFRFFFEQGKNTVRLQARREPLVIKQLKLFQAETPPDYSDVTREYERKGYGPAVGVFIKLQERDSLYRSNPMLAPQFDQGDPTMEPYDPVLIRLNSIGGDSWIHPGDWITWKFEVPQDGFYKIAIKAKQNVRRGFYSNRKVIIDGGVPFRELEFIRFPYSTRYQMRLLSPEGSDNAYLIYLTKGVHTITLEVVLGDLVEIIRTVENSLYDLNSIYRQIMMITSPTPDPMRTYQLEKRIPGLLEQLGVQSRLIAGVARGDLEAYTGQKGGSTVLLYDLARQLSDLADKPDTIPGRLEELRDHLGALGTWLLHARRQPLEIDYLVIASPEQALPKAPPPQP